MNFEPILTMIIPGFKESSNINIYSVTCCYYLLGQFYNICYILRECETDHTWLLLVIYTFMAITIYTTLKNMHFLQLLFFRIYISTILYFNS